MHDLARAVVLQLRRHPLLGDITVPALLTLVFLLGPLMLQDTPRPPRGPTDLDLVLTGPDVALTVASALVLLPRRRAPLPVLVGTGVLAAVAIIGGWNVNLAQLATAIAMFHVALSRPRRQAVLAAVGGATTLGALSVVVVVVGRADWGRQEVVLWLLTAAALGVAVESRRAAFAALEERARRAEETREENARRRVAEDRVRIARELHDVIAHHVAVISVQAGAASHLVERDPVAARQAMTTVRGSAKAVLVELQQVLGVLRQDENALPTAPAPGLAGLPELVGSFAATGTPVRLDSPEAVPQLTTAADVAGYRLVQEALTNVHKHAPGASAIVMVRPGAEAVELVVSNGPPPGPVSDTPRAGGTSAGSGLGLVGMRERVQAAGGRLETGPTADGGFRVLARMPRQGPTT